MNGNNVKSNLQVDVSNKAILKTALPITFALIIPQLNFFANSLFLSKLGETELGAAGITGVFYLVFALVGNGLQSGFQAIVSRKAGEGNTMEIGKFYSQAFWVLLFYSAAGLIITYLCADIFIEKSLTNPVIKAEVVDYIKIRIIGLPFLYIFQTTNALFIATNNSKLLVYGFVIEALTNILLDYLLIFGKFGFPQIGFSGAAVASVIAEFFGMIIVIFIIFQKKLHKQFYLFQFNKFNKQLSNIIFKNSTPLVLQYLLSISGWFLFYILIEHYGERPLAISNAMRNIFGLAGIFVWAFASTSNAMVSNVIGQNKKEMVLPLVKKIALISFSFTALLLLILNIFQRNFLSLFNAEEGFIAEGIPVLRIVSIGILIMAFATVWLHGVTGTGHTKKNLNIEIIAISVYCVYIFLVLKVFKLSIALAWASELVYWTLLFFLSYLFFTKTNWQKTAHYNNY